MAAQSPPPVAVTFVMVGFSGGWKAIWRLPAMVRVVEVSNFGVKMVRKVRKHTKKSICTPMVFRTTAGASRTLGIKSRSDDHQTALALKCCLHIVLISILSKTSSTTKNTKASGPSQTQMPLPEKLLKPALLEYVINTLILQYVLIPTLTNNIIIFSDESFTN